MDDDFLSAFFRDNIEDTEFILRIILNNPSLKVKSVHAQHELKNLNGRSVKLDVHAVEEDGSEADIEIQLDDRGAGFKRARHNSSLLDASILKSGQKPEELPETFVIFITENDVRIETALEMIKVGKLTLEEVAKCSGLPLEKVRELAEGKSA